MINDVAPRKISLSSGSIRDTDKAQHIHTDEILHVGEVVEVGGLKVLVEAGAQGRVIKEAEFDREHQKTKKLIEKLTKSFVGTIGVCFRTVKRGERSETLQVDTEQEAQRVLENLIPDPLK